MTQLPNMDALKAALAATNAERNAVTAGALNVYLDAMRIAGRTGFLGPDVIGLNTMLDVLDRVASVSNAPEAYAGGKALREVAG